jgi:hypothetical protein
MFAGFAHQGVTLFEDDMVFKYSKTEENVAVTKSNNDYRIVASPFDNRMKD